MEESASVNLALLVFTLSWTLSREGHEDQQSESRDRVERWAQRAWERVVSTLSNLAARVKGGRDKPGARARQGREHARGATHQH